MPRANRHFAPGYIWHITHRCHKKEFLFQCDKDRFRWIHWLQEAKERYGLQVLNYMVTSNHIHLLVVDGGKGKNENTISQSMQLVSGRTAQEINSANNRKGAFWEDRYHATAIESGPYLNQCTLYIDLNMVRAGVVDHPSHWRCSGYSELHKTSVGYNILSFKDLKVLYGFSTKEEFKKMRTEWVEEALGQNLYSERDENWTSSVGVGSESFLARLKGELGVKGRALRALERNPFRVLRGARGHCETDY